MTHFDSIFIECPKCGEGMVEFRTQAGECDFLEYDLDAAPPALLESIIGQSEVCESCHHFIHIERYKRKQEIVEVV